MGACSWASPFWRSPPEVDPPGLDPDRSLARAAATRLHIPPPAPVLAYRHRMLGDDCMIEHIIDQRRRDLGGFEVGRVLPAAARRMVGPFVFFDHMGPSDFPAGLPRSFDVRPHPHIGLSTITYLFDGEIMHRDSVGSQQPIRAGEVNWMTAGRGITHSERFERARLHGDRLHGIQAWVALPADQEETDPSFSHHAMDDQPLVSEGGATARLVAGRVFGMQAKV